MGQGVVKGPSSSSSAVSVGEIGDHHCYTHFQGH